MHGPGSEQLPLTVSASPRTVINKCFLSIIDLDYGILSYVPTETKTMGLFYTVNIILYVVNLKKWFIVLLVL